MFRREAPWLVAKVDETGRETLRHGVRSREAEFLDGNELTRLVRVARGRERPEQLRTGIDGDLETLPHLVEAALEGFSS